MADLAQQFLTPAVLERFFDYAEDANAWHGTPLVGGNLGGDPADKGYIVNMKKAGLIHTELDDGDVWIYFTPEGIKLAATRGITGCEAVLSD